MLYCRRVSPQKTRFGIGFSSDLVILGVYMGISIITHRPRGPDCIIEDALLSNWIKQIAESTAYCAVFSGLGFRVCRVQLLGFQGLQGLGFQGLHSQGFGFVVWEIPKHWPCAGIGACRRIMFEHSSNLPGKPYIGSCRFISRFIRGPGLSGSLVFRLEIGDPYLAASVGISSTTKGISTSTNGERLKISLNQVLVPLLISRHFFLKKPSMGQVIRSLSKKNGPRWFHVANSSVRS